MSNVNLDEATRRATGTRTLALSLTHGDKQAGHRLCLGAADVGRVDHGDAGGVGSAQISATSRNVGEVIAVDVSLGGGLRLGESRLLKQGGKRLGGLVDHPHLIGLSLVVGCGDNTVSGNNRQIFCNLFFGYFTSPGGCLALVALIFADQLQPAFNEGGDLRVQPDDHGIVVEFFGPDVLPQRR